MPAMKISFELRWGKKGRPARSSFKHAGAFELFSEYLERINKFTPADAVAESAQTSNETLWICHRENSPRFIDSEQLSTKLQKTMDSGIRGLKIIVGGPNGFTQEELAQLKPAFIWSFGPMTLPHELAAVVAAEQIYRAFSIINHLPYHLGH